MCLFFYGPFCHAALKHDPIYIKTCVNQPPREAQKMASQGRWLFKGGKYQNKIKIWEHIAWLLKTGWLPNKGDRLNRFDCILFKTFFLQLIYSHVVLQDQLSDVFDHFSEMGLEAHMYASQWFLTLFTAKFPLFMVFHILDIFLSEVRPYILLVNERSWFSIYRHTCISLWCVLTLNVDLS